MRLRLLSKMLLFILIPALTGLCVVAGLSYWTASQSLDELANQEMSQLVERQHSELKNLINQQCAALRHTGNTDAVQRTLALSVDDASEDAEKTRSIMRAAMLSMKKEFSLFKEVCLLDTTGRVLYHNVPKLVGMDFGSRDYFKDAMQKGFGIQSLRSALDNKTITTILAVPVHDAKGVTIGVIYGNLEIKTLGAATTNTLKLGKSGVCYVYDPAGVMIIHPNADYIGDEDGGNDWTRDLLNRKNGFIKYIWAEKVKVAHFRTIPETGWTVVLAMEQDEFMAPMNTILWETVISGLVCILIVGLIIFFTARGISSVLHGGAAFVDYVAQGNMTIPPDMQARLSHDCNRGDEIGDLACGIRTMVGNLKKLFDESTRNTEEAEKATEAARSATLAAEEARRNAESAKREGMLHAAACLEQVVGALSSISVRLADQIGKSEQGAAEQAARITETATAMSQMNSTVLEVARGASSAADVSAGARTRAEAGTQVVHKAVDSIKEVQRQSVELKNDMQTLGDSAHAISEIMNVISDIADQTNLLALNAAIEAARAGEAGRGFAVVADEVRKLAEKTMVSTVDVGKAITAIQNNTNRSITQMDTAVHTIEDATALSIQSGEALGEIVSMVDAAADQVRGIATAAEEQSASSEAISRAIDHINDIAGETTRIMRESATAVAELSRQSAVLAKLMRDLKNS